MLTPEEIAAVRLYSGPGYRAINDSLRGERDMSGDMRSTISALDSAIAKSKLTVDMELFRGVDGDGAIHLRTQGLRVGSILIEDGFMSTSANPQAARIFSIFPPEGVMLKIWAPAGTPALDMANFSLFPFEREYLLPRGTRLTVNAYDPRTRTIETEVA